MYYKLNSTGSIQSLPNPRIFEFFTIFNSRNSYIQRVLEREREREREETGIVEEKNVERSCRRRRQKNEMKGTLARHLTVQLGQVSRSQNLLESESTVDNIDADVDDKDFILSQDFFW